MHDAVDALEREVDEVVLAEVAADEVDAVRQRRGPAGRIEAAVDLGLEAVEDDDVVAALHEA